MIRELYAVYLITFSFPFLIFDRHFSVSFQEKTIMIVNSVKLLSVMSLPHQFVHEKEHATYNH